MLITIFYPFFAKNINQKFLTRYFLQSKEAGYPFIDNDWTLLLQTPRKACNCAVFLKRLFFRVVQGYFFIAGLILKKNWYIMAFYPQVFVSR